MLRDHYAQLPNVPPMQTAKKKSNLTTLAYLPAVTLRARCRSRCGPRTIILGRVKVVKRTQASFLGCLSQFRLEAGNRHIFPGVVRTDFKLILQV